MQPSQDYYRPYPPQPQRLPAGYASVTSPSYSAVRPLPNPQAQPRPAQSFSSIPTPQYGSSPPVGTGSATGGYRQPVYGAEAGWAGSGTDSLRRGNGPSGATSPPVGVYDPLSRAGAFRREASSTSSSHMSPTAHPRTHSALPPVPARQPSYPVSPPTPSAPPPHSPTSPFPPRSPSQSSTFSRTSQHVPQYHTAPLPPGSICTATSDLESLVVVPLGSLASAEAVKDVILSRLHIADEDMPRHAFYLTSIGRGEGRPVADDELWEAVLRSSTGEGPQVTVFAKEIVAASSQSGFTGADFAVGMSAERMRQVQHAREKEQRRERERERSNTSASETRSPVSDSFRRDREPSISSRSDKSSSHRRPPSPVEERGEMEEFGGRRSSPTDRGGSGLRSDRPMWTSGSGGASGGSPSFGHVSRDFSYSETAQSSGLRSPALAGQLSPSIGRTGSGSRELQRVERATSITPTASPEDYFHASPPISTPMLQSPPLGSSASSAYHPHLPSPQPHGGSSQIVMGPSGPTRFLPPQPQGHHSDPRQRNQTAPSIQVTTSGWASPVVAPHHASSVPPARPAVPPFTTSPRPLPPQDPRSALPQYNSQPYKNLPLPSSSSPYHNLSLQWQYGSVVHAAPPPVPQRTGGLAPQAQPRMGSKSADNLRGYFAGPPQPPLAPPLPPGYRSVTTPTGHPGAAGSIPPQPSAPSPNPVANTLVTPPSPVPPTPASAFYSAPVQAQQQAEAAEALSSPYGLRSASFPHPHSPSQSFHPPTPRKSAFDLQSQSQPEVHESGSRPSTGHDGAMGGFDRRTDEQLSEAAGRARESSRTRAEAKQRQQGSGGFSPASSSPQQPSASSARNSPTANYVSPTPSAPPFQDDDGAYDGIAEPDRRPLPPGTTTSSISPPSSARSSTNGPCTPSNDAPVPGAPLLPAPRVVDEFGDDLDEETSTWFGTNRPTSALVVPPIEDKPKFDEFGDPIDEETSTWFPIPQKAAEKPKVDEFGDPIDVEASTWFPIGHFKPSAPPPLQLQGITTQVPAPSSYGSSLSPMRKQHSGAGSTAGGSTGGGVSVTTHERKESVPTAQDWTQTILSRFGASSGAGDEEGTLQATGTLRPAGQPNKPKLVDEFGDEIDEDGATFFPGHGPPGSASSLTPTTHDELASPRSPSFDRHKRPNLRLTIDAPTPPTSAFPASAISQPASKFSDASPLSGGRQPSSSEQDAAPLPPLPNISARRAEVSGRRFPGQPRLDDLVRLGNNPAPPAGTGGVSSPFARRNSFAARAQDGKDWAFRPPVETVLEHLDVFFPEHDLDKPVFDPSTSVPSTPASGGSCPSPVPDVSAPPSALATRRTGGGSAGPGLGYKKSIRVVALDRKRQLQKAGRNVASAASGLASNLLRRKSTKLFGARIEEVTSAQMNQISAIKETSAEDPDNFSYKWIKGDLIGRGTYGHVYIALSVTTGETIAVKQVEMPRMFSDKEDQRVQGMISSLKGEIELLKDLDHPNIVLYLGMEQTPEFLSIFLEYVPGGSIGRIIRTHGKFEENVIRFFTIQILDGLQYLHSLGILHRDMKADNILIDQDGMCKISDFGTSKKSGDIYSNNENMSMQGSIFWMAPEVIHNNKQGYSAKADIWSLGCICIEMLAGSRPWEGEGFMGAMFKLGAERMRPPLPPDVQLSAYADQFVSDCLQIEPSNRPKASEAQRHPFLVLDPSWTFTQTSLYRIMTTEEDRRRTPGTPSSLAS
ncbi:hypothetical protein JCM11641_003422 [Rhodosporidiobolus odoratus]